MCNSRDLQIGVETGSDLVHIEGPGPRRGRRTCRGEGEDGSSVGRREGLGVPFQSRGGTRVSHKGRD